MFILARLRVPDHQGVLSESCDWDGLAKQAADPALETALAEFESKVIVAVVIVAHV